MGRSRPSICIPAIGRARKEVKEDEEVGNEETTDPDCPPRERRKILDMEGEFFGREPSIRFGRGLGLDLWSRPSPGVW